MSIRHTLKMVAASSAVTLCGAALVLGVGAGPAGASSLTSSDGDTTLSTTGPVSAGTPYSSGQPITVSGIANTVLNNAALVAAQVPGQTTGNPTGSFFIEECTDPNGLAANLPTTAAGCEAATDDASVSITSDGSFSDTGYPVYSLPDVANLGSPTMVGTCGVAPNQCVLGIFVANPQADNGFKYPHLFSAPFQVTAQPDGSVSGANPGDGTPEVPLAIGLPLGALAIFGGWTIRKRRQRQHQQAA
jgi:hypothetical protein